MKKMLLVLSAFMVVCFAASGALAYTINDGVPDRIGDLPFETYGINVINYTPGGHSGQMKIELFTNYPKDGYEVSGLKTEPADLFILESYKNPNDPTAIRQNYPWAIPLVDHDGFVAGTMYAVGTIKTSDDFVPSGFTYTPNFPVRIATEGTNYFDLKLYPGTVTWNTIGIGANPDIRVDILFNSCLYQDDPQGVWCLTWGTATCANDPVQGCVPIPGAILLLGGGLVRLAAYARRRQD